MKDKSQKRDKKHKHNKKADEGEPFTTDLATAINQAFVSGYEVRPPGRTFRIVSTQKSETGAYSTGHGSAVSRVLGNQELLRMVFYFLKSTPGSRTGFCESSKERCHSGNLAPLARVNKIFWTIATDQIWECIHAIEPFFRVLVRGNIQVEGNVRVLSFRKGISQQQWARFKIHASKVKTLTFSPPCPRVDPGWVSFLGVSKPPDMSWFPAAKRVLLFSDDPLSHFITISVAHQLDFLHIRRPDAPHLPSGQNELEFPVLSAAASRNSTMKALRLEDTIDPAALTQITLLRSLTCLRLNIPSRINVARLTKLIGRLGALEELSIHQMPHSTGPGKSKKSKHGQDILTDEAFDAALVRPPTLVRLRSLTVSAGASTQRLIAAAFTPQALESLHMSTPASDTSYMIPALHLYLRRNLGLTSVIVKPATEDSESSADTSGSSGATSNIQSNSKASNIGATFEALSLLSGLRKLDIEGIQLFGRGSAEETLSQNISSIENPERFSQTPTIPVSLSYLDQTDDLCLNIGRNDQRQSNYGWHNLSPPSSIAMRSEGGRLFERGRGIGKRGRWG